MKMCSVNGCKSRTGMEPPRSFHRFPSDPVLQKQWIQAIGRPVDWIPRRGTRVCSDHFTEDSFERWSYDNSVRTIKKGAFPTCRIVPASQINSMSKVFVDHNEDAEEKILPMIPNLSMPTPMEKTSGITLCPIKKEAEFVLDSIVVIEEGKELNESLNNKVLPTFLNGSIQMSDSRSGAVDLPKMKVIATIAGRPGQNLSKWQMNVLAQELQKRPELVVGRVAGTRSKCELTRSWDEAAERVNGEQGIVMTGLELKKRCQTLHGRIKHKADVIRNESGEQPITTESKVLHLMGEVSTNAEAYEELNVEPNLSVPVPWQPKSLHPDEEAEEILPTLVANTSSSQLPIIKQESDPSPDVNIEDQQMSSETSLSLLYPGVMIKEERGPSLSGDSDHSCLTTKSIDLEMHVADESQELPKTREIGVQVELITLKTEGIFFNSVDERSTFCKSQPVEGDSCTNLVLPEDSVNHQLNIVTRSSVESLNMNMKEWKKREAARKRQQIHREKMRSDPHKHARHLEAEKQRREKRKQEGKVKTIANMTGQEKKVQRWEWNERKRKSLDNIKRRDQAKAEHVKCFNFSKIDATFSTQSSSSSNNDEASVTLPAKISSNHINKSSVKKQISRRHSAAQGKIQKLMKALAQERRQIMKYQKQLSRMNAICVENTSTRVPVHVMK